MPDTAEDADHFGCDAEIDRLVAENVQLRADLDGAKRLNTDLLATLPVEDTSKPVPTTGPKRSFLGYAARTPAPDLRAVLQDTANGMHNFARTASVPDHDAPGWRDCNAAPCARARAALGSATPDPAEPGHPDDDFVARAQRRLGDGGRGRCLPLPR